MIDRALAALDMGSSTDESDASEPAANAAADSEGVPDPSPGPSPDIAQESVGSAVIVGEVLQDAELQPSSRQKQTKTRGRKAATPASGAVNRTTRSRK